MNYPEHPAEHIDHTVDKAAFLRQLSLAKFIRILAIDPDNRSACVQPGVRNLAVSEAAAPFGLCITHLIPLHKSPAP